VLVVISDKAMPDNYFKILPCQSFREPVYGKHACVGWLWVWCNSERATPSHLAWVLGDSFS